MPPKNKKGQKSSGSSSSCDTISPILPGALYLGPCSAASSPVHLDSHSITCVLSIGKNPLSRAEGVEYHKLGLLDNPTSSLRPTLDAASAIIDSALKAHKGRGRVLVHCSAGISRSPTVVVGYLMMKKGMSLKEAMGTVVRAREQAVPNPGFLRQLKDLELDLYGMITVGMDELPRTKEERLALFAAGSTPGNIS